MSLTSYFLWSDPHLQFQYSKTEGPFKLKYNVYISSPCSPVLSHIGSSFSDYFCYDTPTVSQLQHTQNSTDCVST